MLPFSVIFMDLMAVVVSNDATDHETLTFNFIITQFNRKSPCLLKGPRQQQLP